MGFFDGIVNAFKGVDQELIANGILGRGIVTGIQPGGTTVQMGNGLVERSCEIGLQVMLDGRQPYLATAKQRVQEILIPQLATGSAVVAVRVDPADPSRVAVDFAMPPPEVSVASPSPDDHNSAAWVLANGRRALVVFVAGAPLGITNAAGDPMMALTLTVASGEGVSQPYQVQVGNPVPASALPLAYPGSQLHARIGDGPNDVVVDWAAGPAAPAAPPAAPAQPAAAPAPPAAPAAPSYLSSPAYPQQPPVVPPAAAPPPVAPPPPMP